MRWEAGEVYLLNNLDKILGLLEDAGLFTAGQKYLLVDTDISWYGKVFSERQVSHVPERLSGLASMRRPQTAGELMQLL